MKRPNISYSSWSLYTESQLQFYYSYIKRTAPTDDVPEVYGLAGNVVHNSVEEYIKTKKQTFPILWKDAKIDSLRGINNSKLSKQKYLDMTITALSHVDKLKEFTLIPERRIETNLYGFVFKAFIDISFSDEQGNLCYLDWKTNTKHSYDMHVKQRLFYSWLTWKVYGKIPRCNWIYLRDNTIHADHFTEQQLQHFDTEIQLFLSDLEKKGDDITQYEVGNWKGPFNKYASLCAKEVEYRISKHDQEITIRCNGALGYIETVIDPMLLQGFDYKLKFDLKDKFFMQKHAKQYGRGHIDIADVGTYHLFDTKHKMFPIGCLPQIKEIIAEYNEYYGKNVTINIKQELAAPIQYENFPIMNTQLYDYQEKAVEAFHKTGMGVLHMATGSGKTFTAAHIISKTKTKTLWIIDRKELLIQTKEELEKVLGIEVGIIQGKQEDTDKPICIGTIQTIHRRKKELTPYLEEVQFVIVDEYHKGAAETYKDVLYRMKNTYFRLGLTATPERDDGKTPLLHGLIGSIVYSISSQELIDKGYLVKPNITFFADAQSFQTFEEYSDEYQETIIENEWRNTKIIQTARKHKKTLILVKYVQHGANLAREIGCFYISGSMDKTERQDIYKQFKSLQEGCIVMTQSIGAEGLDIKDLDCIINAAANAGDVKTIQVLGRVLRTSPGKTTAHYYDFLDASKTKKKHSNMRIKAFRTNNHEVQIE